MKKLLVGSVIVPLVAAIGLAHEKEPLIVENTGKPRFFAEFVLAVHSADVWRGMVQNDEPVWQPGAVFGVSLQDYGKVYASAMSCFDATKRNRQTTFAGLNAIDYVAGYEVDLGDFTLGAGHIWYTYPKVNGPDYEGSVREFFVTAAYNTDFVVPFIEAYYAYDIVEGVYVTAGLRKEIQVTDPLSVGAEISIGGRSAGMTKYYFDGREGKMWLTDGNATLFAKYDLTDNVFVGARIARVSLLDSDLKGVWYKDNALRGGVNVGVTF
jgi:hypothetical protein